MTTPITIQEVEHALSLVEVYTAQKVKQEPTIEAIIVSFSHYPEQEPKRRFTILGEAGVVNEDSMAQAIVAWRSRIDPEQQAKELREEARELLKKAKNLDPR